VFLFSLVEAGKPFETQKYILFCDENAEYANGLDTVPYLV